MLRLDYLSCVLTIVSTMMIGRRKWQGWLVAAVNSGVICVIGVRTDQTGFIPANVFCLALYACNVYQWRFRRKKEAEPVPSQPVDNAVYVTPDVIADDRVVAEPTSTLERNAREHRVRRSTVTARRIPPRRGRASRSH